MYRAVMARSGAIVRPVDGGGDVALGCSHVRRAKLISEGENGVLRVTDGDLGIEGTISIGRRVVRVGRAEKGEPVVLGGGWSREYVGVFRLHSTTVRTIELRNLRTVHYCTGGDAPDF